MKIFELMQTGGKEEITKCVNLLGVNDLSDEEQVIVLDEITKYVFDINDRHSSGKKTFDLNLDYKYYFPDFLKLGINLNKDKVPWWEFDAILESLFLNDESTLSKMLSYRLYEKPPKNPKTQEEKEHKFRMKMKQKYALKEEQNPEKELEILWNYLEKKVKDGDK